MNTPSDPNAPTPPVGAVPGTIERQWAMFAHLSSLFGLVFPFGNIVGPLVIWLIKRDTMPFVDDQGKEALNFQITVTLALMASLVLMLVLVGFLLLWAIPIVALVLVILATIKSNEGERYRYPVCLRLIK